MYAGAVDEEVVPLPIAIIDHVSAAFPVAQNPIGLTHGVASQSETLVAELEFHVTVIDPPPLAGPGTNHDWFECDWMSGAITANCVTVAGPGESANSVSTNPAPSPATTTPMTTSQVRTEGGRGDLPIELRTPWTQRPRR